MSYDPRMQPEEQVIARRFGRLLRERDGTRRTALVLLALIEHLSLYSGNSTPAAFFLDRDFIGEDTAEAVRGRVIWNLSNALSAKHRSRKPVPNIPLGQHPAFTMLTQPSEIFYLTYLEHGVDASPETYEFAVRGILRALLHVNETSENTWGIDAVYVTANELLKRERV